MAAFFANCAAPNCALSIPGPPDNSFEVFLASPERAGRFIVEVDAFPKNAAPLTYPSLPNCGAPNCSIGESVGTASESILLAYSDHFTKFGPADGLRPNFVPAPRLARRVDIDTAFSIIPTTSSAGQVLIGDVEIFNADGDVDQYVNDYAIDGRTVRILFGPESGEYTDFRVVESSFGKDWRGDESSLRLSVQDLQFRLDQPFVFATYQGTGGIEGDASLTGQLKPRLVGYRYNFTPPKISAANDIYQINNGPIQEVVAVRDGGAELTDSGIDVTSYAGLVTASIAEGEFATALSLGLVRIRPAGGSLQSTFSVEARGDSSNGYVDGAGAIVLKELRDRAGFSGTEIDAGSFTALDGFTTGYWFDGSSSRTFRQVLNQLTAQTNGRIIADSRIRAARIVDPANATFNSEFDQDQIVKIEPEGVIYAPIINTVVKYCPNDTILQTSQILGSVTEPDFSDLQREYKTISKRNGTAALRHRGAQQEVVITTDLVDDTAATILMDAVSGLWSTERMTFTLRLNREALFVAVGSIIKITHPRFGFDAGRNALIIRRLNDYNEQQVELRVLV